MVRALASHARGHRFKSCCLHQKKGTPMWCVFLLVKIGFAETVYYHRFTRASKNEKHYFIQRKSFHTFCRKNCSKRLQCPSGCDKIDIMKFILRRNLYIQQTHLRHSRQTQIRSNARVCLTTVARHSRGNDRRTHDHRFAYANPCGNSRRRYWYARIPTFH